MIRRDINYSCVVPQALSDCLLRIGGTNIYGEPMFRLLLAQDRVTIANGVWNIWPDTATLDDRSGLGITEAQSILAEGQNVLDELEAKGASEDELRKVSELITEQINELFAEHAEKRPDRVIKGTYEAVPVYQMEGWIVEKWKPAHSFGTPEQWNSITYEGEPALGPYPTYGDYDYIAGPTPYQPSEAELREAVAQHFKQLHERAASPAQRVKQMLDRMERRRQERIKELKNRAEAFAKDNQQIFGGSSLEAGRIRNEIAAKAGLPGHWGN
jgi:hypothetical protein